MNIPEEMPDLGTKVRVNTLLPELPHHMPAQYTKERQLGLEGTIAGPVTISGGTMCWVHHTHEIVAPYHYWEIEVVSE